MDFGQFSLLKKKRYAKNIRIVDPYGLYGLPIRIFFLFLILRNVENEKDVDVKIDCSDAFNTSEVFVQFFVVGTIIILHRCLLMANLI